ncbi:hypothetical protein GNI_068960 [Gregarina niphandrodes]|uniref:Ribosome biogenesis protein NOP53 n=1 Tax=Gregarina niphandrodes TaxID=110365 RepID=A0A023B7J2_GRENI|nr:hypothetical protein GNI_068960 [Gregarina niphandrodes]EZG67421.1 hypothetical protein GNI_068960 [Gregarina niphandrodes]|eukprot:XP_011130254.1 hypothetical protein GNI_068960 [Gregarina niphandrodes]
MVSRKWRRKDTGGLVAALGRKAAAERVELNDDDFVVDTTGKMGKKQQKVVRVIKQAVHLRPEELAEAQAALRSKTKRGERKRVAAQAFDIWGEEVVRSGKRAVQTKARPRAPAVVVPKAGQSANPDKGVWEECLFEQAAKARLYMEEDDALFEEHDALKDETKSERYEDETNSKVKRELLDEILEGIDVEAIENNAVEGNEVEITKGAAAEDNTDYTKPAPKLTGWKAIKAAKRKLVEQQKKKVAELKHHREEMAREWARVDEAMQEVEEANTVAENSRLYKQQVAAQTKELAATGQAPVWRQGNRTFKDSGDDVALPEDRARQRSSLRRVIAPETGNALRERIVSMIRRGMIELPSNKKTIRRRSRRRLVCRVRMQ